MRESEHFNLNLVEGSDIVNPLVIDVPNYESIDEQLFKNQNAGVQNATELKTGTIHAITRLVPDAPMITFTATSNFVAGDTFTVDGIQVSALTVGGEQLPTGAYVINSQVLAILKGTLLTVYGIGSEVADNALALNGHPDTYFGTKDEVNNAIDTANAAHLLSETIKQSLEPIDITDLLVLDTSVTLYDAVKIGPKCLVKISIPAGTPIPTSPKNLITFDESIKAKHLGFSVTIANNRTDIGKHIATRIIESNLQIYAESAANLSGSFSIYGEWYTEW